MFTLDNYASKFVEKETTKKHYFSDNGLLGIFKNSADASMLENICAIELYKRYNADDVSRHLYYYNRNVEVDFYIPEERTAIQVSYSIADEETRKREVNALIQLNSFEPLEHALIITYDQEEVIETKELKISVVPVWQWLLKEQFA